MRYTVALILAWLLPITVHADSIPLCPNGYIPVCIAITPYPPVNPSASPSPIPTVTRIPTVTAHATRTNTPGPSPIVQPSATPTSTRTSTPTRTLTPTATSTGTIVPSNTPTAAPTVFRAWANTGEDKVTQDEQRLTLGGTVTNSAWDGSTIKIFGAKNEVTNFNVILESPSVSHTNITVEMSDLVGPGGSLVHYVTGVTGNGVFTWTGNRNIELFYIRYLPVVGVSTNIWGFYDERHVPLKMERPWTGSGVASGTYINRPNHDKSYPDIAVPVELQGAFTVQANKNQSIWADVYIPKTSPTGTYTGNFIIKQSGSTIQTIPVSLAVRNFTLPDMPNAKTMVYYSPTNLLNRYQNLSYANPNDPPGQPGAIAVAIRQTHFQVAHHHKLSLVDENYDQVADQPSPHEWLNRLDGSLFTSTNGYDGVGVNTGNNVYAIGVYGQWNWMSGGQSAMQTHTNNWESWFETNSPSTDRFLYLADESTNYTQQQQWANWITTNPGVGHLLKSFATLDYLHATGSVPDLTIPCATNSGDTTPWQNAYNTIISSGHLACRYNGHRPYSGSFALEDEGTASREIEWGDFKKGIYRQFQWESTYYNDYQSGRGQNNLFQSAQTFGGTPHTDSILGQTSSNYSNSDGVLWYPGTDMYFPSDSYGVSGPIASIRMKYWRRGVEDFDYLTMAKAINPSAVNTLMSTMLPKALWEYGVDDPSDPTYVHAPISWDVNPDTWEAARHSLATIIDGLP